MHPVIRLGAAVMSHIYTADLLVSRDLQVLYRRIQILAIRGKKKLVRNSLCRQKWEKLHYQHNSVEVWINIR